jgi:hypothetical protein
MQFQEVTGSSCEVVVVFNSWVGYMHMFLEQHGATATAVMWALLNSTPGRWVSAVCSEKRTVDGFLQYQSVRCLNQGPINSIQKWV